MSEDVILVSRDGPVAIVTLNRPQAMNALSQALRRELAHAFRELEADDGVRAIVLTGAGTRAFTAGLDLKDRTGAAPRSVQDGLAGQKAIRDIMIAMRECPQPIISIVQGAASGGGLGIALASDIRLCTPEARFNAAFIKIGVSGCDMGSSYFLPRMVGASVASAFARSPDRARDDSLRKVAIAVVLALTAWFWMQERTRTRPPERRPTPPPTAHP